MGTLDLWRVHGKMPYRLHEKRKFDFIRDGTRFVCILDISKFGSVLEEYRFDNGKMNMLCRSKVSDMYYEEGKLVVNTKKGFMNFA